MAMKITIFHLMTKVFRVSLFALAFCASFALAQGTHPAPATQAHAAEPTPAAPATEAQAAQPSADSVAAETAAAEPAPEAPAPQATEPAPVAVLVQETAPAVVNEASSLKFSMGLRIGLGMSDFRSHKALAFDGHALIPGVDLSYSLGLVFAFGINDLISVVPELQYTYYSASNEYIIERGVADFEYMNEVLVYMYSIELPILARFNVAPGYYAEVGPQFGINSYAKIYKNNSPRKPDVNPFAFGPAIGGGISMSGVQLGVRYYFGILEYAENSDGYPWSLQVSLTTFFF